MLDKGNVWYVRHYEAHFRRVVVVYLLGGRAEPHVQGGTTLISLAGHGRLDLLLAPWHLYRFARRMRPDAYLTADQVFGAWTSLLVRLLLGARVRLMPVCQPEVIYSNTGRALSFLPIRWERGFIRWSFAAADKVVTARAFGSFVDWLQGDPKAAAKLVVVDTIAEALPGQGFLESASRISGSRAPQGSCDVVYVGRLSQEKLVEDLLRMVGFLQDSGRMPERFRLRLVGDGPDRTRLEELARRLGIDDRVEFVGVVPNEALPPLLSRSRAFVSTLTGTSLREAALCGVPIVAYDVDWLSGLLVHEEHALLVAHRAFQDLGMQLVRLIEDEPLQSRLSGNMRALAQRLWSAEGVARSLATAFSES